MVGAKNPLLQVWLIVKSPLFHFDWHFQSENVDSVELGIFDSEIILTRQSREMLTENTCLPSTAGCHVYSMHTWCTDNATVLYQSRRMAVVARMVQLLMIQHVFGVNAHHSTSKPTCKLDSPKCTERSSTYSTHSTHERTEHPVVANDHVCTRTAIQECFDLDETTSRWYRFFLPFVTFLPVHFLPCARLLSMRYISRGILYCSAVIRSGEHASKNKIDTFKCMTGIYENNYA